MKKKFIGFYNPTKDEIDEAWKKGIFAFDANTLLNLYRYTDNTRDDFLNALKTIKERLFLPYQAAFEYQNNRLEVIDSIENSYDELYDVFPENFDKHLKSQISKYKKHPSIIIEKINKLYDDFLENLNNELNEQKLKHPDFRSKDDVLNELTDLFDNSVGDEFSKEDLLKIYKEGESRYSNEIPPGYKDQINKKSKGLRHIYGDLIIWKELINNAKSKKYPLIFITDDRKEDWWTIQKGKTIRPREELIKEFFDITGIRILIYNADNFLLVAKEQRLLPELKDETIEEVKDIRVNDEKEYKNLREILMDTNLSTMTLSEIIENKSINPNEISKFFNSKVNSKNKIYDYFNFENSNSINAADIVNYQGKVIKSFEDLYKFSDYKPQETLDKLNAGLNSINHFSEFSKPLSTRNKKSELKLQPKPKPQNPKNTKEK